MTFSPFAEPRRCVQLEIAPQIRRSYIAAMRILTDYQSLDPADRGASVAIGNFDGIHLGHRSVIDLARKKADERQIPLAVMTFEPHPREFFRPEDPPFRLMNRTAKAHRLEQLGVDILYQLPFNADLAGMAHDRFVDDVLYEGLAIKVAVAGGDFRFGKGRTGTVAELAERSAACGFEVAAAPMLTEAGREFSSTAVRAALTEGSPGGAAALLGHWHRIEGRVARGAERGRTLGFPTANIDLAGLHPPRLGIYAVLTDILSGPHQGRRPGVASIGVRPTFGQNPLNLEVFIFEFDEDIYGEEISVALIEFQRPEFQFPDAESLVNQMRTDCEEAQRILACLD